MYQNPCAKFFMAMQSAMKITRIGFGDLFSVIFPMSNQLTGGWCWFQDPRAVRFVGEYDRTYVGYADAGKIMVAYYDHGLKKQGMPLVVCRTRRDDDHIAPSILILPDGHFLVFWSKHCLDYIHMRHSVNPEDISCWEDIQTITSDDNCCYTNPVYLNIGRMYLIYRDCTNWNIKWIYSDDHGHTWSKAQVIADFHNGIYNEAYTKVESVGNTIHLAASACKHGEFATYRNIYHAYFDGNNWKNLDGTILRLPLTPDSMKIAFNSGLYTSWIWDLALDENNYPVIVFSHKLNTNNHEYWYTRWNGSLWEARKIVDSNHGGLYEKEPAYSGGVCLDHGDPSNVYASVYKHGNFEIKKFRMPNVGNMEDITKGNGKWNLRPVVPRNASAELQVFWMHGDYASYTNFNTVIKYHP